MLEDILNIHTLLACLKRLWWVPVLTLAAGAMFAYAMCQRLPKIYQASTLILVEPQKIPVNYVKPIVTTPIDSRVKIIHQQVSSRSRLEKIIKDLDLYPEMRARSSMEDVVARVARSVRVEVRGNSTFKVYYEDQNPVVAARVANAVAEQFINENVAARKAEARGTTTFLEQQLLEKKQELERQEALITEFNRRNMESLPGQQNANFQMLEGLRARLQTTIDSVSKEQDRKILLESQLADLPTSGVTNVVSAAVDLDQKRQRLIDLRSQYTEQHPEVALLKRQIAELEDQLTRQAAEKDPNEKAPPPAAMSAREQQLRSQIAEVGLRIRDLNRERDRVEQLIGQYESRVASAPRNEQLLLTLRRDYDILQQSYLELLRNKTQAVMAESLEEERQGEQFIVIDRAVPPGRPFKPNVMQIMAFGCAIGLMGGVLLAFGFDLARPRFRSEDELRAAFGLPVLVSIPDIAGAHPQGAATAGPWEMLIGRAGATLRGAGRFLQQGRTWASQLGRTWTALLGRLRG